MLRLENLSKVYRTETVLTAAIDNLTLEIADGDFAAIMGPSGCGKSTLLNILGMLDTPTSGAYRFAGEDVAGYGEARLADLRKRNIGFVFQSFNLIDELTVFENVELALLYHGIAERERRSRVETVMERVGIAHRAGHLPAQLSGGQQQRVAIARAVVAEPKLILADEPTGNLDSQHGAEVMDMLCSLNGEGTTIVMVTHSSHDAARAKRMVNLLDGRLVDEALS
jgi:putative ABC transport system ATP-binding protein